MKERHDHQHHLSCKMRWLCQEYGIPPQNIWNVDETAMSLWPGATMGWRRKGFGQHLPDDVPVDDDEGEEHCIDRVRAHPGRAALTATLAVPMCGDSPPKAQIIFRGVTDRVLPRHPWPANIECVHTASKWASTESLMKLVATIEAEVPDHEEWLLLWDCAPQHTSEETRRALTPGHPRCHPCYVPRQTTCICQPLDRSYMRSVKAWLREAYATQQAKHVLGMLTALEGLPEAATLKADLPRMISAALTSVHSEQRLIAAWRPYLMQSPGQLTQILEDATITYQKGTLFDDELETHEQEHDEAAPAEWDTLDGPESAEPDAYDDALSDWMEQDQSDEQPMDHLPPTPAASDPEEEAAKHHEQQMALRASQGRLWAEATHCCRGQGAAVMPASLSRAQSQWNAGCEAVSLSTNSLSRAQSQWNAGCEAVSLSTNSLSRAQIQWNGQLQAVRP